MQRNSIVVLALTTLFATSASATHMLNDNHNNNRNSNSNVNANRANSSASNQNRIDNRDVNVNRVGNRVDNRDVNVNRNQQHQGQGQKQGQGQSQGQSLDNRNRVTSGNNNGNLHNAGNNTGTSASTSSASQSNANVSAGNVTSVTEVNPAQARNPVASAVAPMLTSANDSCMGSTSVGAQGVTLGVSVGHTWTDENCVMLKNTMMLWNMGRQEAAVALMCGNDKVREALELAGTECPQTARKREEAKAVTWDVNDPYIAARMRK